MSSRRPEASAQTFSIFAGFYFVVDVKTVAFITIFFFSIVPRRSEDWPKKAPPRRTRGDGERSEFSTEWSRI